MEVVKKFPNGYFAVYQGKRYRANGGGGDGRVIIDDSHQGAVPIAELDEWYFAQTMGTYLDEPFRVNAELDTGQYWISYEGGNGRKIAEEWRTRQETEPESTFWQEDRYTFMARVPKDQVTDIHEVRRDALGPWRERESTR